MAVICLTLGLHAEEYALGPDSQPQPGVPKGSVTAHVLPPGKYFPGVPHDYSIYVPSQYDASKATPFMIFLDGSGSLRDSVRVPVVFDNLIAKHELPPMIGIFVNPGVLPAASEQAQSRFERVFEYDSLSDRFSSFLIGELIPAVGARYNLSKDPNDRGIAGVSTGAVGAFAAAWNRPDQFRRVLSFIGTFVAMKGADRLPALIRRTEPKPIRVFLQAGKHDHVAPNQPQGTFYAGSWPVNNQIMDEAFQFAGYDAKFVLGDEAHNMKHGAAIMPEALRWLWLGFPDPIAVKEPAAFEKEDWDPRGKVYSTVWASKGWERVEGANPAASEAGKTAAGRVYSVDAAAKTVVLREASGRRRVVYRGNDLAVPSGIALSPDQAMAVVTDRQSRFSWSFQIAPDGTLRYGEPFYRLEMPEQGWMSGVEGAAFDSIGQVYFATPLGVQVCEANGRVAMILNSPEHGAVTSVAFGGPEMNWLYATVNGKVYRRPVKVKGVPPSIVAKLPKPPL